MAVLFPDIPQTVDPAETLINHPFDHLTACVNSGRAPGKLCYPRGVAIDSDANQIYVAEGYSGVMKSIHDIARVSIFSETGEFLKIFSHPCMKHPYGIAIHRDNVYVTDKVKHSVFHFKIKRNYRLVAWLGGRGSGNRQFNDPEMLTVSTNGFVWVTDCANNRIKILDGNLHYQRHLSHHSMTGPFDVKLSSEEVFVLCRSIPCVKVFSYTGDLIRSLFTRYSDIGMLVITPSFFCLDTDSNLLLCNRWRHQIKIFSKEGILLHTLGKVGQSERFYYNSGMALINNQKLVVVSMDLNCLQIYSSY